MPESKVNSARKGKTIAFKNAVKEQLNPKQSMEQRQIYRQPLWSEQDVFPLTGTALAGLANFLAPYRQLIQTVDAIMTQGEIEGKIKTEFFYENGEPVAENDPRLPELREKEEKRIGHWRKLISDKQAALEGALANIPTEIVNEESEKVETIANEVIAEMTID